MQPRAPSAPSRIGGDSRTISRRGFLGRGLVLGGALIAAGPLAACGASGEAPAEERRRVVIVGAGLAGLTCAHRLRGHGLEASLYEARPDRVGGRCWTARGFAADQVAEHGGEFIDSDHARIRALAAELGLGLEDGVAWERRRAGVVSLLYLDGSPRKRREILRGFPAVKRRLREDARRTGYLTDGYDSLVARRFDATSAAAWLERNVPGGSRSPLGELLSEYLSDEFGLDPGRLSATNLFYILEEPGADPASSDGSDERYHVRGGNDQIPRRLASGLPAGSLHLDAPLEALWRRRDGSYGLRFGGVRPDVAADRVVLAIPFATLRRVDLAHAGLSRLKRKAIEQLGMGTNAKLLMQFRHRPAHFRRWNGELVSDHPLFDTWDTSLTQPGRPGLLTVYTGGAAGTRYRGGRPHGPAPAPVVRETLAALERSVPGISADFNGRAWLDQWSSDPGRGAPTQRSSRDRSPDSSARSPGPSAAFISPASTPRSPTRASSRGRSNRGSACAREVLGPRAAALHGANAFA